MYKKYSQGFTLIELLVVIAIIGILASVVLASLNSARTKGQDARTRSQLASMRAQAMLYSGTNASGGNTACQFTATATTVPFQGVSGSSVDATNGAAGCLFKDTSATANDLSNLVRGLPALSYGYFTGSATPENGGRWVVGAPLSSGGWACVDFTGTSTVVTAASSSGTAIDIINVVCR